MMGEHANPTRPTPPPVKHLCLHIDATLSKAVIKIKKIISPSPAIFVVQKYLVKKFTPNYAVKIAPVFNTGQKKISVINFSPMRASRWRNWQNFFLAKLRYNNILLLLHTDRLAEGMRELEPIVDKRDVVLCAPMLLVYAHKRCKTVGKY